MDGLPTVPVHVEQTSPAFWLHFGGGFNMRLPVELLRNPTLQANTVSPRVFKPKNVRVASTAKRYGDYVS